jgi:hypothetical protein
MKVYRIEDADGRGPYSLKGIGEAHAKGTHCPDRNPSPKRSDVISFDSEKDVFGFRSMRQFRTWFLTEDRKHLAGKGYLLSVYSVPRKFVLHGRKQLAFRWTEAKRVSSQPIPI